jgi:hypothetical protein
MVEASSDEPKIEGRVLKVASPIATSAEPKGTSPITNLLAEERSKRRLRAVDQFRLGLHPKQITGRCNPCAPIAVFTCCRGITLVEGDGCKQLAATGQVVRRGKAKIRRGCGIDD